MLINKLLMSMRRMAMKCSSMITEEIDEAYTVFLASYLLMQPCGEADFMGSKHTL
jgi:hypothetical protein